MLVRVATHLFVVIQGDHADVRIFGERVSRAGLHQSLSERRRRRGRRAMRKTRRRKEEASEQEKQIFKGSTAASDLTCRAQ